VFELGVVLAARTLWEELGIGPAIRACAARAKLTAPHEIALFAMAANRLDEPISKLACAERWLPDIAWLPDATGLAVDQCYRALDFLAVWSDEIERDVFLKTAVEPRNGSLNAAQVSFPCAQRIKSLCGAKPPQKLRWTNAGRWAAIGAMEISPGRLGRSARSSPA
jgi:hypothetical protein